MECHRCGRICTTKSGMTKHMKSCISGITRKNSTTRPQRSGKEAKTNSSQSGMERCQGCGSMFIPGAFFTCDRCRGL